MRYLATALFGSYGRLGIIFFRAVFCIRVHRLFTLYPTAAFREHPGSLVGWLHAFRSVNGLALRCRRCRRWYEWLANVELDDETAEESVGYYFFRGERPGCGLFTRFAARLCLLA